MQTTAHVSDVVTKLVPGGSGSLAQLSDRELLANTRSLVGKSNQVFAALLAHLAEVEARGLHRTRACSSLYTYCIYELRFSEDGAARRAGAAKLIKRFPLLLEAIAHGELHLTGLLMLGPHLTAENVVDVLARAKFRTKKELGKLVRELHPLPLVPDLVEPLGLAPPPARRPTWEQYVTSLAPAVRELPPGERPRDWANDTLEAEEPGIAPEGSTFAEGATSFLPAPARVEPVRAALPPHAPMAPLSTLAPQQYQMQFSTSEEHVQLVERAKALLARSAPGKSLGELHLQAMKLLVQALEKQKFALTDRPRQQTAPTAPQAQPQPARRSRYVPAAIRRRVFERDGGRCTFVDDRGERCRETHGLELHHQHPFGKLGQHATTNLTLHCPAHNALAAEHDFGAEHMARQREPARHETLAAERRAAGAADCRGTARTGSGARSKAQRVR